jgi:hypothetical protein
VVKVFYPLELLQEHTKGYNDSYPCYLFLLKKFKPMCLVKKQELLQIFLLNPQDFLTPVGFPGPEFLWFFSSIKWR